MFLAKISFIPLWKLRKFTVQAQYHVTCAWWVPKW